MRLCFLADGRSPIAQNWIRHFVATGHEVHLISSYPCDPADLPVSSLHVVPVAFSSLVGSPAGGAALAARRIPGLSPLLALVRGGGGPLISTGLRHWLGPLDVYRHVGRVRRIVTDVQPDLVHAMRIPFEGMLAAEALAGVPVPLVLSVWGNDLTFLAARYPLVGRMARRALKRADALHPDCERDLRLATRWGFDGAKPAVVLPGNGGIHTDLFYAGPADPAVDSRWAIPPGAPVVLNPRGYQDRGVRNDTFFRSVPLVLEERPDVIFLGVAVQGTATARRWVKRLGIGPAVRLLPWLSPGEMADLMRRADVMVSPSEHDGTPNTLLEAMASGAFPVVGDIEPAREWVDDEVNGLLCDPASPESLARAVLRALGDAPLRRRAGTQNQRLIAERAEHGRVMRQAEAFYQGLVERSRRDPQPLGAGS